MITRQKSEKLQLCLGYRNVHDGMWKKTLRVERWCRGEDAESFGFGAQEAGTESRGLNGGRQERESTGAGLWLFSCPRR